MSEEVIEVDVKKIFEELKGKISQLDYAWERYVEIVKDFSKDWYVKKTLIQQKIMEKNALTNYYRDKILELEVKKSVGLIDEENYNTLKEDYKEKLDEALEELNYIKETLKELEDRATRHLKRVFIEAIYGDKEEIKRKIEELEKMYEEGRIRQDVYLKLKNELEQMLRS